MQTAILLVLGLTSAWMLILTMILYSTTSRNKAFKERMQEAIEGRDKEIVGIRIELWKLQHPPEFKIGDVVWLKTSPTAQEDPLRSKYQVASVGFESGCLSVMDSYSGKGWIYTIHNCADNIIIQYPESQLVITKI